MPGNKRKFRCMKIYFKDEITGSLVINMPEKKIALNGKELKDKVDFEIDNPEEIGLIKVFSNGILIDREKITSLNVTL